jgi:hypothetical protein
MAPVGIVQRCRYRCRRRCLRRCCVASVRIRCHLVVHGTADMGGNEFTAAVVAAINDALLDRLQRGLSFVIVHGRAADDVVHVRVVHAGKL